MTRLSEFHFASQWGLVLLVIVPALLFALFSVEWRRRRARAAQQVSAANRGLVVLLLCSLAALLCGLAASGWVLLFTVDPLFEHPVFLTGLGLLGMVPLLGAIGLWVYGRLRPVFVLSTAGMLEQLPEGRPLRSRFAAPLLRLLAVGLVILALARPQVSTTESDVFAEGMDIMLTLDVSTSMRAVDFYPPARSSDRISRIEGAKETIRNFIQQRKNDRLGLVVFSAEAFTQCPLTLDYSVIQNILQAVRTGVIEDGTAIGDALMVSVNRLRDSETKSKVLILVTDGDDNMSRVAPVQAAEIAAQQGIQVFPILVGKGGKVPYPTEPNIFGQVGYQYVELPTNPDLLKKIAEISKGKFYRAVDQASLEEDLQDVLDHMEKTRLMDPGRFTRHTEVFQLALLPALLAVLLELCLRWTRFRAFP